MANQEQVELLKQGVQGWNQWREEHPDIEVDLSEANFYKANLTGANLIEVDLSDANLSMTNLNRANLDGATLVGVNLIGANLSRAELRQANLRVAYLNRANLIGADLIGADLSDANLTRTELRRANLIGTNLSEVNLNGANLRNACLIDVSLIASQLLGSNLNFANLTGACIHDWHINSATLLEGVICEYIYLKSEWSSLQQKYLLSDRRPSDPNRIFAPGEFQAFVQKALSTVDLIFADGIDWQAFFQSFQELRSQYDNLSIQAIEKKSGGAFVIRLEVPPEADKAAIESQAKELYEMKLQLQEQRYRAELQAKDGQISLYQEQLEFHRQNNTNLMEIVKTMAEKETPNITNDLRGANIANFANQVRDSASQTASNFTQTVNSNIDDITKLIAVLRDTAQTFPDEQREEALGHLEDLEEDLKSPNSDRTPRRIKATLAALLTIAGMVAATTDFGNNVLELSEKLGIELIQPHLNQQLPPSQSK